MDILLLDFQQAVEFKFSFFIYFYFFILNVTVVSTVTFDCITQSSNHHSLTELGVPI